GRCRASRAATRPDFRGAGRHGVAAVARVRGAVTVPARGPGWWHSATPTLDEHSGVRRRGATGRTWCRTIRGQGCTGARTVGDLRAAAGTERGPSGDRVRRPWRAARWAGTCGSTGRFGRRTVGRRLARSSARGRVGAAGAPGDRGGCGGSQDLQAAC